MAWHRPARQITGMSFYGFKIWQRTFHGLYRARHPIHKAMGGHASHGHTSDRVFIPFQFREGTIKTLWPRTPISRLLFNSIMVQLEHPAMHKMLEIIFVSIPLWFNWDMRTCRRPSANACFNSIMVQLEQDLKLILRKKLS